MKVFRTVRLSFLWNDLTMERTYRKSLCMCNLSGSDRFSAMTFLGIYRTWVKSFSDNKKENLIFRREYSKHPPPPPITSTLPVIYCSPTYLLSTTTKSPRIKLNLIYYDVFKVNLTPVKARLILISTAKACSEALVLFP